MGHSELPRSEWQICATLAQSALKTSKKMGQFIMAILQQQIFDNMLAQFDGQQHSTTSLLFNSCLDDEQLNQLTQYITTHPNKLTAARLSLYVDKAMLQNIHYQSLLEALKKTALQKLDLAFPVDELKTSACDIAALLNEYVSDRVNYPVIICEQSSPIKPYQNQEFDSFNAKVITHVQQHNQTIRFGTAAAHQPSSIDEQPFEQTNVVSANAFDKKIKLKALIKNPSISLGNFDKYIKLEVQHTQVEQQEQTTEEIIDVAVQEQEQEQGFFEGQL